MCIQTIQNFKHSSDEHWEEAHLMDNSILWWNTVIVASSDIKKLNVV